MRTMTRGLQGIVLLAVACALPLSMGACPSIDPAIDPIINPNPDPVDQAANPAFSPAASSFQDTLEVTISCATSGATIRYTLDGTVPSGSSGTVYTSPITLAQTTTVRAVAFHDSLDPSDLVTVTYTRSAGSSLTISSPVAACALVQGRSGTIDLNCMVTATLCEVQSVTADLSAIGGAAAQTLTRFGNYWYWFGTATPPTAGTRTITFTAAGTTGVTTTAAITTVVSPAPVVNTAPAITAATVVGQLVRNQAGTVTVSCTATDAEGAVQSVCADLSAIGGSSAQYLTLSSGTWAWTGPVTPLVAGTRTITFTATDELGAQATASAVITVVANQPPVVTAPTAIGTLVRGQAGTLTVSCQASDMDGTVQSARADLTALGGSSIQSLTFGGGVWTWSGTVTPPLAAECTITFSVFDNQGTSGSASTTILVTAPNVGPSISSVSVPASLVLIQSNAVTISCTATDSDGTVQSVTTDLSAFGGLANQTLNHSGDSWGWSGFITVSEPGPNLRTVTLTATDDDGAATTISRTIQVVSPNEPPYIYGPQAAGVLSEGSTGIVTVSCIASDPEEGLMSVEADLSAVGGSSSQALALIAGRYTWSGEVTPPSRGIRTITFTATDTEPATSFTTTTIEVAAPSGSPSVTNASATGDLVLNEPCSVTVTCDAADVDGTVQSVTVNLSAIGGSSAQALLLDEGHWTWTGSVTPATTGTRTVTFTATDNAGQTGSASTTITVFGSLTGVWAGNVTYNPALVLSGSPNPMTPFVKASTMTFSAGFQPVSLPVYFGKAGLPGQEGPLVVVLPAAGLLNPGDQSTVVDTSSGSAVTVTGTVVQMSRSATAFSIDLNVEIVMTSGNLAGPYHWEAAMLPGDRLSWSETTLLDVGGSGMIFKVISTGTLTRQ